MTDQAAQEISFEVNSDYLNLHRRWTEKELLGDPCSVIDTIVAGYAAIVMEKLEAGGGPDNPYFPGEREHLWHLNCLRALQTREKIRRNMLATLRDTFGCANLPDDFGKIPPGTRPLWMIDAEGSA